MKKKPKQKTLKASATSTIVDTISTLIKRMDQLERELMPKALLDAEQHRAQSMYERLQWSSSRIQHLEEELRAAKIREEGYTRGSLRR